ncbi:beta-lactamase family protein [Aquihabitans sp. G128]|uniref:serine hydrolase domain-containing protein n=1 Tax=Aquihabitans sp. G128 TaxID=2849779 RepID=UPI001C221CB4|nr:serine hydrolase [Aquihabitans sp. G128]QXC61162.1 beta-lactamase family protein [Aquihabitans sp. G128]
MPPIPTRDLQPLPGQPEGVAWPTDEWPRADAAALGGDQDRLDALLDELVGPEPHPIFGLTHAAAVVVGGHLVAERYGRRIVQDLRSLGEDPPFDDLTAKDELLSWSMAKSISHLAVGVAIGDGKLSVTDAVPERQWQAEGDPRGAITWDDLLAMRPGLEWREEYYDLDGEKLPDVINMLFGDGAPDMATFAASFPLVAEPGSEAAFNYSSGTTNIVVANLQRVLGLDADGMDRFLHERIFDPIGMRSARAEFDETGTFIGSSYAYATLQDWCRFGLLALRNGEWDGVRLVPDGWIAHGRTARSWDDEILHGAHWWTWDQDQMPFGAHGFEGQRVICFPTRDVVLVRLGKTASGNTIHLNAHLTEIAGCFPER